MSDRFEMTMDSAALQAKLNALGGEQIDKIMASAFRKGAEVYQEAVIAAAPERPDVPGGTALPPGALKSDVIIKKAQTKNKHPEYKVEFGEETAHVAEWVEYGHRLVKGGYSHEVFRNGNPTGKYRGSGREVTQVPPHEFFRKAFETASNAASQVVSDSILSGVDKAFNKGK